MHMRRRKLYKIITLILLTFGVSGCRNQKSEENILFIEESAEVSENDLQEALNEKSDDLKSDSISQNSVNELSVSELLDTNMIENMLYENTNSPSIDVVGTIEKRFFDAEQSVTGYAHEYYVLNLDEEVTFVIEDAGGSMYELKTQSIQISYEVGAKYDGKKVACRGKGWDSLIGELSCVLEIGGIVELQATVKL